MRYLGIIERHGMLFWGEITEKVKETLEILFPYRTVIYLGNGIFSVPIKRR